MMARCQRPMWRGASPISRPGTCALTAGRSGCCTSRRSRRCRLSSADTPNDTEFDAWLQGMVARHGEFTVLVILTKIGERSVVPLCSTYLHVVGDDVDWNQIKALFARSGRNWDGAAFFPTKARNGGPIDRATVRDRLTELEAKVVENRMVLNDGHFFDAKGRRFEIKPVVDA